MDPANWDKIKSIFIEAAELPRAQRSAFLAKVCGGDMDLRGQVEKLLAEVEEPESAGLFHKRRSSLENGQIIQNRFRIRRFVGRGGMGEVYEADDLELGGRVALKTIRPELLDDPESLGRFRREVQLARHVTHPNVCRVFDLGVHRDGETERVFLTMEFLDGETLSDLMRRKGKIEPAAALPITGQIIAGLQALHDNGVVHRDFKPGNVIVAGSATGPARAVISDFGLARAVQDPTIKVSRTGDVRGTPDYMAPEQLLGQPATPASDIYSLGLVLYEMITGRRAFAGGHPVENAVQRVVEAPAEPQAISEGIPQAWNNTILHCLEREPARRPASATAVWNLLSGSAPAEARLRLRASRLVSKRTWMAAALGTGLASAALIGWLVRSPGGELRITNARRLTQTSGLDAYPRLSPDGAWIVFASDRGDGQRLNLWKQPVAGGEAVRLTNSEADDTDPDWSSDGSLIAFRSTREQGGVFVIPAAGGTAHMLGPAGRSPRFEPGTSRLIFSVPNTLTGFGRAFVHDVLPLGEPRDGYSAMPDFEDVHNLTWIPGTPKGTAIVIFCGTRRSGDPAREHDFWVTDLWKGEPIKTGAFEAMKPLSVSPHAFTLAASSLRWMGNGVLFVGDSAEGVGLWHLPMNASYKAAGLPRRLLTGIHPAISGNQIAYSLPAVNADVWTLPIDANRGVVTGPAERITTDRAEDVLPSISPDGGTILFGSRRGDAGQLEYGAFAFSLWRWDRATGKETAVTTAKSPFGKMKYCPSPARAVYRFLEGTPRKTAIYETEIETGKTNRLCAECGSPTHCSADGKTVVYEMATTPVRMALLEANGDRTPLLQHAAYSVRSGRLSTDGWIAFHLDRNDLEKQIFVARLRGRNLIPVSEWIPVSGLEGANQEAVWSPDSRLLYFLSDRDGHRCVWAQPLDAATKRPSGPAFSVYHLHKASMSTVTAMGRGPWHVGLSIGGGKLTLSLADVKSEVWLADLAR